MDKSRLIVAVAAMVSDHLMYPVQKQVDHNTAATGPTRPGPQPNMKFVGPARPGPAELRAWPGPALT